MVSRNHPKINENPMSVHHIAGPMLPQDVRKVPPGCQSGAHMVPEWLPRDSKWCKRLAPVEPCNCLSVDRASSRGHVMATCRDHDVTLQRAQPLTLITNTQLMN